MFERDSELYEIPAKAFSGCEDLTFYGYGKGTAAEIFANQNGLPYVDLTRRLIGDANGNGQVEITDVTAIQYDLACLYLPIEKDVLLNGDVDDSGKSEITDAVWILRWLSGADTTYTIGEKAIV